MKSMVLLVCLMIMIGSTKWSASSWMNLWLKWKPTCRIWLVSSWPMNGQDSMLTIQQPTKLWKLKSKRTRPLSCSVWPTSTVITISSLAITTSRSWCSSNLTSMVKKYHCWIAWLRLGVRQKINWKGQTMSICLHVSWRLSPSLVIWSLTWITTVAFWLTLQIWILGSRMQLEVLFSLKNASQKSRRLSLLSIASLITSTLNISAIIFFRF